MNEQFLDETGLRALATHIKTYTESRTTYRLTAVSTNTDSVDLTIEKTGGGVIEPSEPVEPKYIGAVTSTGQTAPSTFSLYPHETPPVTQFKEGLYYFINDPDANNTLFDWNPDIVTELSANNLPTDVNAYTITEPLSVFIKGYEQSYGDMKIEFSNYANLKQGTQLAVCYVLFSGEQDETASYLEDWRYSFDSTVNSAGNIVFGATEQILTGMMHSEGIAILILSVNKTT